MCNIQTTIITLFIIVVLILLFLPNIYYGRYPLGKQNKCAPEQNTEIEQSVEAENNIEEGFFGGYYYPYDYPYNWPFFYTGCNEDVFGNIKCLPMYMHPFW